MSSPDTKQHKRRSRLEKRLTEVRQVQEKRGRQAERAQARGTARKVADKRARQLEKATRRASAIEAALSALGDAATAGPSAYCLRERTVVAMRKPEQLLMRNGRAGLAGTCPSCGARVVRPG